jgi:histidinol-phosphatase (PHP family)
LLQPWVDSARARGLSDIAFTDHDRYHEGIDFDQIERLRDANPDVKIRAGIELDNDPVHSSVGRRWVEIHWEKLDFVLGSVHYLERADQMFDTVPEGAGQFDEREIDAIYRDYFRRVREMAATGLVDCLAHLDLVKIHGHRPTSDVRALVGDTLDFINAEGLAIELSTAGWRKPVNELYPSDPIIELALAKGIPFTTASDAHSHVQLGENYRRLEEKMKQFSISEVCVFEHHKQQVRAISAGTFAA